MSFKTLCMAMMCLSWLGLSGCSSAYKQRQIERDRVSQNSGLFCEFVNGDEHNDIDVELNLQMAKKCDASKPYNLTNYKNASDIFGIVYCCATNKNKPVGANSKPTAAAAHTGKDVKDNKDVKTKEPKDAKDIKEGKDNKPNDEVEAE